MLSAPFSAFVNHMLASADWAKRELLAHAGKTAEFEVFPARLAITVTPEGMLQPAAADAQAATRIRVTHATLLQILSKGEDAWRKADVEGDTDFAAAISRVAAHLRWDVEEDLSKAFGDIAARRMAQAGRSAAAWPRQAATDLAASLAEYLTEEKHVLVTPLQASEFVRRVDELRDAVERLDKRIERVRRLIRDN